MSTTDHGPAGDAGDVVDGQAQQPSTALTVINRVTGETIDVAAADSYVLARFCAEADDLHDELRDAEEVVKRELLGRLDADAEWTQRFGDPKVEQFVVTVPSPNAKAETYPAAELRAQLQALVDAGVISARAAGNALRNRIKLEIDLPFGVDAGELALKLGGSDQVLGVPCRVARIEVERRAMAAGLNRLRLLGDVAEQAIVAARVLLPMGNRRVKVERAAKERANG